MVTITMYVVCMHVYVVGVWRDFSVGNGSCSVCGCLWVCVCVCVCVGVCVGVCVCVCLYAHAKCGIKSTHIMQ